MEHMLNQCSFISALQDQGASAFRLMNRDKLSIPETLANWCKEPFTNKISKAACFSLYSFFLPSVVSLRIAPKYPWSVFESLIQQPSPPNYTIPFSLATTPSPCHNCMGTVDRPLEVRPSDECMLDLLKKGDIGRTCSLGYP
jgi:hypothetical protein|uniref:Uncharacterized protein n=1 Tax=Picea glauca TaxID=3330 RepID=A0A101LW77_PICGL|nr:hypothetical protein ABT39_MTgene1794 [Picea glauca]QHR86345.1 hypothetical protein Q903MT_gene344 [Picea sitchensis]